MYTHVFIFTLTHKEKENDEYVCTILLEKMYADLRGA